MRLDPAVYRDLLLSLLPELVLTGWALVLLLFSSTVIPLAASKSEEIRTLRIEKKPPAAAVQLKQPWTRVGTAHATAS